MEIWNKELLAITGFEVITTGRLIIALSILLVAYLLSRLAGFLLARRLAGSRLRPDSVHTIKRITFFIVLALTILAILGLFGIPLTAFAFATGAIAIGLGFGAQNIINNFISGWILMAERPIRIDDFVEIDGSQGTVEYIGTRSTRIRRTDGVHMLVPNSHLLERTVVNWTLIDQHIRTTLRVGVEYGSPVDRVAALIMQAVTEQVDVNSDPPVTVVFEDFGDNALVFEAYFWCDVAGEKEMREIRSQIRFRIAGLFDENNIVVAFPQRDVHLDMRQPLEIRLSGESDR